MSQPIKRTLAVVVLVFGCMVAANAHQPCEEKWSRAEAVPVEDLHVHAELATTETKKTIIEPKVKSAALTPALPQVEAKEGGDTCLRASCSCTSSTHNNPYCRATGGDCANHPGLLCIW